MPRRYRPREVARILTSLGYELDHHTGSHANYRKLGYPTIVVPEHRRELPPGTFASIRRQMVLTNAEFDRIAEEVL